MRYRSVNSAYKMVIKSGVTEGSVTNSNIEICGGKKKVLLEDEQSG
jgi:hypothetical protein